MQESRTTIQCSEVNSLCRRLKLISGTGVYDWLQSQKLDITCSYLGQVMVEHLNEEM